VERDGEVALIVLAVEEAEEGNERRRDDDHVLGVAEGIAEENSRTILHGGGHRVETTTQGSQTAGHGTTMVHRPFFRGCSMR
jgi:hypothetical protein